MPICAQVLEQLEAVTPEQTARGQAEYWARTLALTQSQADSLRNISLRFAEAAQPVARSSAKDSEKLRTIAGLEEQRETEVLDVLTPEQRKEYLAVKQQMADWAAQHVR